MRVPAEQTVEGVVAAFARRPEVLYAEPNYLMRATETVPADPYFGDQWSLKNSGQTIPRTRPTPDEVGTPGSDIKATSAWDVTKGDSAVKVAVVDTGVDYTNPDIAPNIWIDGDGSHGHDYVSGDPDPQDGGADEGYGRFYHGTHVAGTVGAAQDDTYGVVGVAWHVSLMAYRVLGLDGKGSEADIANAFNAAADKGARIVNASLGGTGTMSLVHDAIARNPNTLFVVSAGNDGRNVDEGMAEYPCNDPSDNVICVAATGPQDELAGFSNFGSTSVDLGAPGVGILSDQPDVFCAAPECIAWADGTSMAAPHVAGAAALLLSAAPSLTPTAVKTLLLDRGQAITALDGKTVSGKRLDVYNSLRNVAGLAFDRSSVNVAESPTEPRKTAIYNIHLNSRPADSKTVTVALSVKLGHAASDFVSVNPTSLSFNSADWNIDQEITVTAASDHDGTYQGARTLSIVHHVGGDDPTYSDVPDATMLAFFTDEDDDHVAPVGVGVTGAAFNLPFQGQRTFGVGWTGVDNETGLGSFSLRIRQLNVAGATASDMTAAYDPSQTSAAFNGAPGYAYCFDVSATDLAPAPNTAGSAARCTGVPLDERAMAYKGTWSKKSGSSYYLGTYSLSKTQGAYLVTKTSARARRIYLVATKCHGCGTVEVYIGKTLLKRLSLDASSTRRKQIIKIYDSATLKSGAVKIRVYSSGKPVYIEGLGLSSVRGTV